MTRAGRKAAHPSASALAAEAAARIAALPDPAIPALRAVRRECHEHGPGEDADGEHPEVDLPGVGRRLLVQEDREIEVRPTAGCCRRRCRG
jgi:hypothetical protein